MRDVANGACMLEVEPPRAPRAEDDSIEALFADAAVLRRFQATLASLAWRKYRINPQDAADVVQTAFATFLRVRHRYQDVANQKSILVGIFYKSCLEHIARSVREKRHLQRLAERPELAGGAPWLASDEHAYHRSALQELLADEQGREIRAALASLGDQARTLVALIERHGFDRQWLIVHFGLNKNTFDSRLHLCRKDLRRLLQLSDIEIRSRVKSL